MKGKSVDTLTAKRIITISTCAYASSHNLILLVRRTFPNITSVIFYIHIFCRMCSKQKYGIMVLILSFKTIKIVERLASHLLLCYDALFITTYLMHIGIIPSIIFIRYNLCRSTLNIIWCWVCYRAKPII